MSHSSTKQTLLDNNNNNGNKSDYEYPETHPTMMNERSYSHSLAVLEKTMDNNAHPNVQPHPQRYSRLNLETPIPSDFEDSNFNFNFVNITPQISVNNSNPNTFDQLLSANGYGSYSAEFHQTGSYANKYTNKYTKKHTLIKLGINSLSELIRFATQCLPPSINVTPSPMSHQRSHSPTFSNMHNHEKQIKFKQQSTNDQKQEHTQEQTQHRDSYILDAPPITINNNSEKRSTKKHKLRLYEVEELLEDDVYCEYALLIRDGGNPLINGYYTCSGKKNGRYMFNHMNDNKAALYCAKNGTWMIVYDDEMLYGNPLKYDSVGGRDIMMLASLNLYPPPPRCWYSIEGINPPPGVMWIEITENPMAFVDEDMAQRLHEANINEKYMNKLKVDLPVQMIDFMFCGPIGFALRIDPHSNIMDVIRIRDNGQAKELGLKHGDTLLKIDEEDVSQCPDDAFPALKECVQSQEPFTVTFLRKKYDELVINVQRAGSPECNGKYVFLILDEYDAPIFVKDGDENWRILRLDHDEDEGHSIWGIQNIETDKEYYIGISDTYAPPNNTWEAIEENAKNPAPGLQFMAIDSELMRNLVPDDARIKRQTIFVPTKRKRKKGVNKEQVVDDEDVIDEQYEFGNEEVDLTTTKDSDIKKFRIEMLSLNNQKQSVSLPYTPSSNSSHSPMLYQRSESVMSTKSIYAVPDDVQNALSHYQDQVVILEKELKAERKRAMTLSHQHKTAKDISKEAEEKLNKQSTEFTTKIENIRDELYTVNNAYYQLYIKANDTKLDYTKINRESYQMKMKFSQTKKQLFQAKRKIDDLEEEIEELTKELEAEKMREKKDERTADDVFADDFDESGFDKIELETEIASLKAANASKDIIIDELRMDNEKWQSAHDSIFERMTEAQTRMAGEIAEFEDAKKFYEKKLSVLRDKLQDNSVQFWQYERRLTDIGALYQKNANQTLPEWKNKPNITFHTDESQRVSITYSKIQKGRNKRRGSESMNSNEWDENDKFGYDPTLNITLNEDTEDYISEEDNNNAFGAYSPTALTAFDDHDDANGAFGTVEKSKAEFECDSDDDGTNAFG